MRGVGLMVVGMLAGCALLPGAALAPTPAGQAFSLARGQTFQVVLAGHGTAGYQWQLTEDYDRQVVAFATRSIGPLPAGSAIGASAPEIFTFTAKGPGRTVLNFLSLRPWEATPSFSPEKASFSVTVS